MSQSAATSLYRAPGHYTIAQWEEIGIVHWLARGDSAAMERVHATLEPMVQAHPKGVSFIHIIHDGAGLPDADARKVLTRMMDAFAAATVCVGVVLLGNGFWASAMQSVLTGLRLLAPPRRWQMRFETTNEEMACWVVSAHEARTGRKIDPDLLTGVLTGVLRNDTSLLGA